METKFIESIPVKINIDDFSIDDDILNEIANEIEVGKSYLKIPNFTGKYYRISTISDSNSFLHCILKMLNKKYNESSLKKRLKMAKEFRNELKEYSDDKKLQTNDELSEKHYGNLLCEILKININLYTINNNKLILYKFYFYKNKPYKRQTFCMLKNLHKLFEPIAFLTDNNEIFFNFESENKDV